MQLTRFSGVLFVYSPSVSGPHSVFPICHCRPEFGGWSRVCSPTFHGAALFAADSPHGTQLLLPPRALSCGVSPVTGLGELSTPPALGSGPLQCASGWGVKVLSLHRGISEATQSRSVDRIVQALTPHKEHKWDCVDQKQKGQGSGDRWGGEDDKGTKMCYLHITKDVSITYYSHVPIKKITERKCLHLDPL